jgi:hypothetical protein
MLEVRYWVMKEAVRGEYLEIIAQAVAGGDDTLYSVSKKLKRRALESLLVGR